MNKVENPCSRVLFKHASPAQVPDCGNKLYTSRRSCCCFRLKMPDQFWGRRSFCLVTGASQGIGRSFAVEFAHRFAPGSHLVLLARSLAGLEQTKTLISTTSPHVSVQVNISPLCTFITSLTLFLWFFSPCLWFPV